MNSFFDKKSCSVTKKAIKLRISSSIAFQSTTRIPYLIILSIELKYLHEFGFEIRVPHTSIQNNYFYSGKDSWETPNIYIYLHDTLTAVLQLCSKYDICTRPCNVIPFIIFTFAQKRIISR